MSKVKTSEGDGVRSEATLRLHLRALREAIRQQLQETERKQAEELEKRVHEDALLSTEKDEKSDKEKGRNHRSKRSSPPTSTSHSPTRRPPPSRPASVPAANCGHRSGGPRQCERFGFCKTTQRIWEEEAEAECRKKFSAAPVPGHVRQPVYRELVARRERERRQGLQDRRRFLLSMQKPFGFQEREKEKREELMATVERVANEQENKATPLREGSPKGKEDSPRADPKEQDAVSGKVRARAPAIAPPAGGPKLRTAERTRRLRLGFLDEGPSFRPKIIREVPDFGELHRALQKEALQKPPGGTKCQPFFLRTSALPARKSRTSLDTSQVLKPSGLSRSKSVGALTSMSADTLPTYITDAARSRGVAIRKSIETRESKSQESAEWLRGYQSRSQAMRQSVALHAKLLDPRSSLRDVRDEGLRRHRAADRQRTSEYARELRDMRARVSQRPYLFEQVKQRNARALAEQTYSTKLRDAGLKETFVEEAGKVLGSEDEGDVTDTRASAAAAAAAASPSREENVDDGEKIEDVEEKSVKSKGEEMP